MTARYDLTRAARATGFDNLAFGKAIASCFHSLLHSRLQAGLTIIGPDFDDEFTAAIIHLWHTADRFGVDLLREPMWTAAVSNMATELIRDYQQQVRESMAAA